jgi:hypothetical protein
VLTAIQGALTDVGRKVSERDGLIRKDSYLMELGGGSQNNLEQYVTENKYDKHVAGDSGSKEEMKRAYRKITNEDFPEQAASR